MLNISNMHQKNQMPEVDAILRRNNITLTGHGEQVLLLAHGFGCSQQMWRFLLPLLSPYFRILLFDYVGSGGADLRAYDKQRYATLAGYAEDIVEICQTLDLTDVVLCGHSVSGMIGLLAAQQIPQRIHSQIMVCPSPCFLNDPPGYAGGFATADLQELLDLMDKNYIDWAHYLAPLVTGAPDDGAVTVELANSFCSTNPLTAKNFAKATFFSDYRTLLPHNQHPVLLLQSARDALASVQIGQYMHQQTPMSELRVIEAKGHCLHMTHPTEVAAELLAFLRQLPPMAG